MDDSGHSEGAGQPSRVGRRTRWASVALAAAVVIALTAPSTAFGSGSAIVPLHQHHFIGRQWDPYFYYDPYDPCAYSACDPSWYGPSQDYYFDPGSSCDASICDQGYYNPSGDFYYDPGSSTDSNLVDTSSFDWSGGDTAAASDAHAAVQTGAWLGRLRHRVIRAHAATSAPAYVFVDAARSYRLVYPSNWQRLTYPGLDFDSRSPDANAGVDALAVNVPAGQSVNFNQVLQGYFSSLGGTPVTGEEQSVAYLGDTRQAAEVEFRWNRTGVYGGTVVVMIQDHGRAYLLAGVVANLYAASQQLDALQVSSTLSSLDVLHTLVVPRSLAVRFTDRTHSYRFTYAKDWRRASTHGRADLILHSPDNQAAVVSLSRAAPRHKKSVTNGDMHSLVSIVGRQVGRVTGTPIYHAVRWRGVLVRMVSFSYQTPRGVAGRIFIVGALHHRRICVVAGVVLNNTQAATDRDAARVSAMISTLGFV